MASIEGRTDDVLHTADGRRIGRLDPVFKANIGVREAQIIQESLDRVRVLYVPGREFSARSPGLIANRIRERMGNIQVILERTDEIPRTKNGKFRAVICKIPAPESQSLKPRMGRV